MLKSYALAAFIGVTASTFAHAQMEQLLVPFVGYTILAATEITGWQDQNGKRGDSFEGCQYGRVIFLSNNKQVTCASYAYQYGYRPLALILGNGGQLKMLVGGEVMDMSH